MFSRNKMTEQEKNELAEYRGTGLSPRQIRTIKREAAKMREYIEFLESL